MSIGISSKTSRFRFLGTELGFEVDEGKYNFLERGKYNFSWTYFLKS